MYHSRKYELNEDFFTIWTAEMAYVLGFWYADGNMHHDKSYRVRFYSNDRGLLADISMLLSSTLPVLFLKDRCFVLTARSKKLFYDLMSLGGRPAKSRTLAFPEIPEVYVRDFIRGYFDGDGSVHFITYKASKNGKYYTNIRSNFTCGSKDFLEALQQILYNELGLHKKHIGQFGPYQFKLGYAQTDTALLLKYMYYMGHVGSLKRKADFLKKLKD